MVSIPERDETSTTFRPSCRVFFAVRLDEPDDAAELVDKLEREPPDGGALNLVIPSTEAGREAALRANASRRKLLEALRDKLPASEYNRQRAELDRERRELQAATGQDQKKSEALKDASSDRQTARFTIIPKTVNVQRTSFRDAESCTITFDFADLPIDPRCLRAAWLSVDIGAVSADDYAAGLQGRTRADGSLLSLVERSEGQELGWRTSTRFVGVVDEWRVSLEGESGDMIEVQCRDISAVLRDQELPRGDGVDLNLPVGQGIQELIDRFPASRGIKVQIGYPLAVGDPLKDLQQAAAYATVKPADAIPEVAKLRGGKQARQPRKADESQSVWDAIETVVLKLGLIPLFRGWTLFLLEPRGLFSETVGLKKMVWGRNIEKLEWARKLAGIRKQTVEVRSFDRSQGIVRWARHPVLDNEPSSGVLGERDPQVTRPNNVVGPAGVSNETVTVYNVANVTSLNVLENIAISTYEQQARQEIEGSFRTLDIRSFRLGTADESLLADDDLLDVYPGDPVQVLVADPAVSDGVILASREDDPTSNYQKLVRATVARRAAYLVGRGFSVETATRLSLVQESVPLTDTFRVGAVNLDWDADEGVAVEVSFYNFITVAEPRSELAQREAQARIQAELAGDLAKKRTP